MFKKTLIFGMVLGIAGLCLAKGTETAIGIESIKQGEIKKVQMEAKSGPEKNGLIEKGIQTVKVQVKNQEKYIRKELITQLWQKPKYSNIASLLTPWSLSSITHSMMERNALLNALLHNFPTVSRRPSKPNTKYLA